VNTRRDPWDREQGADRQSAPDPWPTDYDQSRERRGHGEPADQEPWSPHRPRATSQATPYGAGDVPAGARVNPDLDLDRLDPSGHARRRARARTRSKGRTTSGRRRILKWTAIGIATTLVAILAVGAYVVEHLTGNIKHTALIQAGVTQSPEPTDKYGRSPVNILIIGSDGRNNAADCKLGGDCGPGANSDVLMLVHLAADRSNATIMSIPRDTMVNLPTCTNTTTKASGGGYYGQINASLQWGPSCTVTTVHEFTGLTIDHYIMVDFSGVVTMSNALGGVPVCVSNKMYDSYSGLRLNAGTTVVQGQQALQFVRTRHGFYDGSDPGREKAQHYFLSAMIREVRANMNLTAFTTLYKIANAATSALTVDDALSGATNLLNLAVTMNRVPTSRITFVTMPWQLDPANLNRVIAWQPQADKMFANLAADVSYSAGSAGASTSTTAASSGAPAPTTSQAATTNSASVDKARVHVQVYNAGGITGRAAAIKSALVAGGFSLATTAGTAAAATTTKIYHPATRADSAAAADDALGLPASALTQSAAYSEVTVVIGADWPSGTTYSAGSSSGASTAKATTAATAPEDSSLLNASTTTGCVQIVPGDIVK
jgi:LCP family protein required for cell wall assembly